MCQKENGLDGKNQEIVELASKVYAIFSQENDQVAGISMKVFIAGLSDDEKITLRYALIPLHTALDRAYSILVNEHDMERFDGGW